MKIIVAYDGSRCSEAAIDDSYGAISSAKSKIKILVVSTNEELLIARDTVRLMTLQM